MSTVKRKRKRVRRRSGLQKWQEVKEGIVDALKSKSRSFDELMVLFKNRGITEQYLSDCIADLLLFECLISQEEIGEDRIYSWKTLKSA